MSIYVTDSRILGNKQQIDLFNSQMGLLQAILFVLYILSDAALSIPTAE